MLSRYPAKFGSHRNCGSGDLILLNCPVTSYDHVFKLVIVSQQLAMTNGRWSVKS